MTGERNNPVKKCIDIALKRGSAVITALASATGEKRHPREEGGEAPRFHRTGGEAPC